MANHDLLRELIAESREHLGHAERDVATLAHDATGAGDALPPFSRTLHTIKGTAAFFDFSALAELAHCAEELVGRLREGVVPFDGAIAAALLDTVAALRRRLDAIEHGHDGAHDAGDDHDGAGDHALLARLVALQTPRPARIGALLVQRGVARPDDVAAALEAQRRGDARRLGEILVDRGVSDPASIGAVLYAQTLAARAR